MIRFYNTIFILLFFLIITFPKLYPQIGSSLELLSTEDGLQGNQVFIILQDRRGFLWIGALGGLSRYDGYEFKTYSYNPDDDKSLSNNDVRSIYEDRSGVLWIGTFNGLNKYNRNTDDFTRYLNDPEDSTSLSYNWVWEIFEDQSGTIWIGTDGGGLNKFDREQAQFTNYTHNPNDPTSVSNNIVVSIFEDDFGALWVGTGGGLNKFDIATEQFTHYIHDPDNPNSISNDYINAIYKDKSGDLWIGTNGGLNKLILGAKEFTDPTFIHYKHDPLNPNTISGNSVSAIYEDDTNKFWITTIDGGLNKFDKRSGHFSQITNVSTWSILQDRSGILWIGTDLGVHILNKKKLFKHYKNNPDDPKSFSGASVFPILEYNKNEIWIGTNDGGGLNRFIRDKEEFLHYKHDPTNPNSLSNDRIVSLYKDENDILWIGTWGGIDKLIPGEMNKANPSFIHLKHNPNDSTSLCGNKVSSILTDSEGSMWISTHDGGISILTPNEKDKSTPVFINNTHYPNDPASLNNNRVESIYEDRLNTIWIPTFKGLVKFEKDKKQFILYKHEPDNPNSLSDDRIFTMYEDISGFIWVGTPSGLNKYDRERDSFIRYNRSDGLASDLIYGILEDDHGNLWISTGYGLSRFNPKTETFKNFDHSDGLQGNDFNQKSCFKSSSGEMYFGGTNGFNVFHPDSIKDNTYIPPIVITEFQLNNITIPIGFDSATGRSILEKAIEETNEIELLHEDNVISFEFAALDYHIPEKNQYAYMMEGFDADWKYTDASRPYVTYTNLDPGEYIFKVKGSNNDGYWNEEGVSIGIIILPPWWATTWAYIIYALLIFSIIYFTWRMQLKRIKIKHDYEISKFESEKMHEVDDMKSRFFANISHEFRTPLTLIFGPAKDVLEETNEPKTKKNVGIIKRNASRLYSLVNQLLDLSKLEAGKMALEVSEQNIIPLLKGLVLSFTSLAERKKITLQLNTIEENLNVYIDKDKVEKIITNLLSNAFKFTPEGGKIDFTVEKMINEVEIRIADNGVGIPKERIDKIFDRFYQVDGSHTRESEGTGIGLALTKELVELHKGKIKVESKEREGTTLTVQLPLGKDHLKPEEIVEEKIIEEEKLIAEESDLFPEMENKKEKTDIDVLLDTDKSLLLIVEDNPDVRNYILSHLEDDYRVQEAVDGEDGLSQALAHIPDLIISDVMMPKMDGFELCEKLKTDEKTSHIPIIMLTAKATSQDKIEGYETGADDYIMKPFDATELKVRIKNLIEIRRKLQEKFSSEDFRIPTGISNFDKEFLQRVMDVIEQHISEENFSIEDFEKEIAMSSTQTNRKLKALAGRTPSQFLRSVRLVRAKKMILSRSGNISEIAYSVGFSSPAYFTKCFKEEFGYPPTELLEK